MTGQLEDLDVLYQGSWLDDGFPVTCNLNKRTMSAAVGPGHGVLIAVEAIQFWIAVSLNESLLGLYAEWIIK